MTASDSGFATPQALLTSILQPGAGGNNCAAGAGSWALGGSSPVKDGATYEGAAVRVQCRVSGTDASGYDVIASATLAGAGTIAIRGHFGVTRDRQPNIAATFTDASGLGSYGETDCTAVFAATGQGIAPGRIWANLTCPKATDAQRSGDVCEGLSEFRFENCAQQ